MKPDNWIDGLIWKDKNGKFWKIDYLISGNFLDYPFHRLSLKNTGVSWRDKTIEGYELTNLTEEEAYLIENL